MSSLSEMLLLAAEIKNQSAIDPEVPQACPLLSASDMANALKISKTKAYQIIQRREIPSVSINRTVRIRQEDLEAFIRAHIVR